MIRVLESGGTAITAFSTTDVEAALAYSASAYDGIVFEMEHGPYDNRALRDALQYMLNRRQIVQGETLAPSVTPLVRIPPNGGERNQWIAKQVLDSGVYGVVWPHVSTVEDAYNAVLNDKWYGKLRPRVLDRLCRVRFVIEHDEVDFLTGHDGGTKQLERIALGDAQRRCRSRG